MTLLKWQMHIFQRSLTLPVYLIPPLKLTVYHAEICHVKGKKEHLTMMNNMLKYSGGAPLLPGESCLRHMLNVLPSLPAAPQSYRLKCSALTHASVFTLTSTEHLKNMEILRVRKIKTCVLSFSCISPIALHCSLKSLSWHFV